MPGDMSTNSLLLWALRRYSGMILRAVGEAVGGLDYTAVAMAIKRFEQRSEKESKLRQRMKAVRLKCEKRRRDFPMEYIS